MAKELSMSADAVRKRQQRAAKKAIVAQPIQGPVILKVGHAFIKGKGNAKPKKDSIWGIMQYGDVLVKFFGRRGGAMRFKQEPITELDAALELYAHKLAGTDAKKLKHSDLDAATQKELLGDDWPQPLFDKYTHALEEGKVDRRTSAADE
ncbi:hypothetical protein [Burkholderia vietnamiensis]|uniref:hypothetical protein n=1 Tax=Burkholderia vietnamiensis TaxID=60552 RepID=UPI001588B2E8|nr:hypothetical protein [Burkholderia vietnamiensis]